MGYQSERQRRRAAREYYMPNASERPTAEVSNSEMQEQLAKDTGNTFDTLIGNTIGLGRPGGGGMAVFDDLMAQMAEASQKHGLQGTQVTRFTDMMFRAKDEMPDGRLNVPGGSEAVDPNLIHQRRFNQTLADNGATIARDAPDPASNWAYQQPIEHQKVEAVNNTLNQLGGVGVLGPTNLNGRGHDLNDNDANNATVMPRTDPSADI